MVGTNVARSQLVGWSLALALGAGCRDDPPSLERAGVLVERVVPGYAADRAGVRAGTVLIGWRRAGDGNVAPLDSPFALRRVELEEAPLSPIVLVGADGEAFSLPPSQWKIEVTPPASPELTACGDAVETCDARWRTASAKAAARGERETAAWWMMRAASRWLGTGSRQRAEKVFAEARRLVPSATPWVWEAWAVALGQNTEYRDAAEAYEEASRSLGPGAAGGWIDTAWQLQRGVSWLRYGELDAAERQARLVLGACASLKPESRLAAEAHVLLGKIHRLGGRFDDSDHSFRRALQIAESLDAASAEVGNAHYEVGTNAFERSELEEAAERYRLALELSERAGVRDQSVGSIQMGLGRIAWKRGDYRGAERHFQAAREIFERDVPGSPFEAWSLNNLGLVASDRGDLDAAQDYYERALVIRRRVSPTSYDHAASLINLGTNARARGRADEATKIFERARAIAHDIAPGSDIEVYVLANLGSLALDAGELERAEHLFEQTLALLEERAPGGLDHADVLHELARLHERSGRLGKAEHTHLEALAIRRRLAPESAAVARSLHALAALRRERGDVARAVSYYEQALDVLDEQERRVGGGDVARSRFGATFGHVYKELIGLYVELGRTDRGFEVLERYRSRVMVALLAERDMRLDGDLPSDLALERRRLRRSYDGVHALLQNAATPEEVERLNAELRDLRRDRQRLVEEMAKASPRLRDLESPRAVSITGAKELLDADTVVLSYSVGEASTFLFVLTRDELQAHEIPRGSSELRGDVERFRLLVAKPTADADAARALDEHARALYRVLVGPVAETIRGASPLWIVPDEALHILPFAALVSGEGRYLVEDHAIVYSASMTLVSQLRASSETDETRSIVVFADPASTGSPPLPAAREEAETIASIFAESRVNLGEEATESRVIALDSEASIVHFASHAFVDELFPLDSYLALTPAEGNGRLQAWEIFEELRLDADLVTLSACETGLGVETGGEGLLGLTRAFQYAGARSVLASLWGVSDRSTAGLMARFYRSVREGQTFDKALRAAQLALIRRDDSSRSALERFVTSVFGTTEDHDYRHPFYWAAFQLQGTPGIGHQDQTSMRQ